jgi:hypothetical protein
LKLRIVTSAAAPACAVAMVRFAALLPACQRCFNACCWESPDCADTKQLQTSEHALTRLLPTWGCCLLLLSCRVLLLGVAVPGSLPGFATVQHNWST